MTTLTLELGTAAAIDRLLVSGRYTSSMAVIREAVAVIADREAALADLGAAIDAGVRSADAGNLISVEQASRHLFGHAWTSESLPD